MANLASSNRTAQNGLVTVKKMSESELFWPELKRFSCLTPIEIKNNSQAKARHEKGGIVSLKKYPDVIGTNTNHRPAKREDFVWRCVQAFSIMTSWQT
jgi:hypothetical protein